MEYPRDGEKAARAAADVALPPERRPPTESMSRRQVIRKSAEVAALSLFGVTALDSVVDRVLEQMQGVQWMRAVANEAASALHEAGIGAMAFAACGPNCNPAAVKDCTPQNQYTCNPFSGARV